MASQFRKYKPETGKLIRHKVWFRGRKALSHMTQLNDNWNRSVNNELTRLNSVVRMHAGLIGQITKMMTQTLMPAQNEPGKKPN